jgi:hypothetical protein
MNLNKIKGALAAALEAAPNKKQAARLMELNSPSLIGQQGPDLQEAADILSGKWNPAPVPVRVATDIPPRQPRAKPRTQEEMLEIVNRVGPQLQKQFVRKPDKTESVASKSKKRHDREAAYQHDIEAADQKLLPELDIADRLGTVDVSLAGDASRLGTLRGVNGLKLNRPVELQAGPLFEEGWASGIDTASDYWKMMGRIQKQYGGLPVNAVYSNMASEGLPYAVHYEDALLSALNSAKVPKKNLDAFDQMMRNAFPNFVGVRNQDEAILQMMLDPKLRKHFAHLMELEGTTKNLGTPRGYDVKHAVEEPDLTTTEGGISGFVVKRPDLSLTHLPIETEHNTYGLRMPMETLGRQKLMLPKEVQFHDTLDSIMKNPLQANNPLGTLHFGVGRQIIDQQQVDQVKMFEELMKKYYGMRKGGLATGGVPEKRNVSQLFPLKDSADNPSMLSELKNAYGKESKTYGDKGAAMDILNRGFVTDVLGGAVDLANMPLQGLDWLASKIPALSEPASVMDKDSERVASFPISTDKPWGGKDAWNELFQKSGITSKTERPIAEMATSLIAPFAPAVAGKTAKLAAKGAKALAPTAAEMALDIASKYGVDPRMNIIKPKGGNWVQNFGSPEDSLRRLYRDPTMIDEAETLNNFIQKKIGNYVKNEMGTESDPIRKQADAWYEKKSDVLAQKQKQIDKATADMEAARVERGFTPEMMTKSQARIRDLETEKRIIQNQIGLHFRAINDPTRGAGSRAFAGSYGAKIPDETVATSPMGTAWENAADSSISAAPYRMHMNMTDASGVEAALRDVGGEYAVQNPNALAYRRNTGVTERTLGFDHLVDELKNALNVESGLPEHLLLQPKTLDKMSVAQASEHVDKINAWRAAQKHEADAARAANKATVVQKEYPEHGLQWVELRIPEMIEGFKAPERYEIKKPVPHSETFAIWDREKNGYITSGLKSEEAALKHLHQITYEDALKDALKYEGEQLNHCVGGYCPDVLSGNTRIFSLRDKDGKPHATIEVKKPSIQLTKEEVDQVNNAAMKEANALYKTLEDNDKWRSYYHSRADELYNQMIAQKEKTTPESIKQVKGESNAAPKKEVQPFVQDFIKSGNWSEVKDLNNTGLFKVTEGQKLPGFSKDITPGYYTIDEFKKMATEHEMPQEILDSWIGKLESQQKYGYAHGGAAHMADGGVVNLDDIVAQALSKNAPVNLDEIVNRALSNAI